MTRTVSFVASTFRPPAEVGNVILEETASVLGAHRSQEAGRVTVDLAVPLGPKGRMSWPASVEIRAIETGDDRWRLSIHVSPVGSRRRFPTFAGVLEISGTGPGDSLVQLRGSYRLPMGALGAMSGAVGGDRLARASLEFLFASLMDGIRRELVDRSPGSFLLGL